MFNLLMTVLEKNAEAVPQERERERAKELIEKGKKATDASREIASLTGFKKNEIYKELL